MQIFMLMQTTLKLVQEFKLSWNIVTMENIPALNPSSIHHLAIKNIDEFSASLPMIKFKLAACML